MKILSAKVYTKSRGYKILRTMYYDLIIFNATFILKYIFMCF